MYRVMYPWLSSNRSNHDAHRFNLFGSYISGTTAGLLNPPIMQLLREENVRGKPIVSAQVLEANVSSKKFCNRTPLFGGLNREHVVKIKSLGSGVHI